MVSELVKLLRTFTRPLRRQFWWPIPAPLPSEKPGVVLISFAHLSDRDRLKLGRTLNHSQTLILVDSSLPVDHINEHLDPEPVWAQLYRVTVLAVRTLQALPRLLPGVTTWAQHLCECDDLARLHLRVMEGRCYVHLGSVHSRPVKTLRQLRGFVSGFEGRPYETWVIDRAAQVAYLPATLPLPEVPLTVAEVVEMARRRPEFDPPRTAPAYPKPADGLRIMSYNLHSCVGLDARLSVRRIAEVLYRYQPDVVLLQEIDRGCSRTQTRDQLKELQTLWPSQGDFFPLVSMYGGQYGIGFLTRLPLISHRNVLLASASQLLPQEPRGAQELVVSLPDGGGLRLYNTHLGLTKKERLSQIDGLLKLAAPFQEPSVLAGDFNCRPTSREYRRLLRHWRPSQTNPQKTWFGTFPLRHLDYCFVSEEIEVLASFVPKDGLTRIASDHLPVITDLRVRP